jgi:hypothetical protein
MTPPASKTPRRSCRSAALPASCVSTGTAVRFCPLLIVWEDTARRSEDESRSRT